MLHPIPEALRVRASKPEAKPAGEEDRGAAPPAKDAATIAVVRQGEGGIEAFLMRRQASMAFAAGMYVFPGGGVQQSDTLPIPWIGPGPEYFAERFACSPAAAHALVVAAARETFEETGVLLAGPNAQSVVADTTPFSGVRATLEAHEASFADFLREQGLSLRADLLGAWAHWITPEFEPRRYDTRFFVTVLPEGQRIESVSGEADRSLWVPVDEAIAYVERGQAAMLPPTITTCRELAAESAASILASATQRRIRAIMPRIVEVDGELWLDSGED